MRIGFHAKNVLDGDKPAGGVVVGTGFTISWQDGPLGRVGTDERTSPNGAFVEDVLAAVQQRIEHYNASGYECPENVAALRGIATALEALDSRTTRRVEQGVEGTHEGK